MALEGQREILAQFDSLPDKLQRRVLVKVFRSGGVVIRDLARGKVRRLSGRLAKSIRVTVIRQRSSGWIAARVIAGRTVRKDDPFYAWMLEGGTKPHEIRPKGKKSLFIAGLFAEVVQHPGAAPRPFMRPALEEGADAALAAMQAMLSDEIANIGDVRDL
jgi:HK97 gp10 family phage protein